MLRDNISDTARFVAVCAAIGLASGADLNTTLFTLFFTFVGYAAFARRVDLNLLSPGAKETGEVLGAQIGFAAKFLIVISAGAVFGDQYTAFFGGIILWHIYMVAGDSLSQNILRGSRDGVRHYR